MPQLVSFIHLCVVLKGWTLCFHLSPVFKCSTKDLHTSYGKMMPSCFVWKLQKPILTMPAPNYLDLWIQTLGYSLSSATTESPSHLKSLQTKFNNQFFKSKCQDLNWGPLELEASLLPTQPHCRLWLILCGLKYLQVQKTMTGKLCESQPRFLMKDTT
jgi:hypothetical protein